MTILRIFLDKTFDDLQTSIEIIKIKSSKLAAKFHLAKDDDFTWKEDSKLRISWLQSLYPRKLTRNPKIEAWKVIFRFQVNFPDCI